MKQLSQWITVILLGGLFAAVGLIIFVAQSDGEVFVVEPVVITAQETPQSGVQSLVPTSDPASAEFAPTIVVPVTPDTNFEVYTVGPGDTLADIATRYGTTWKRSPTSTASSTPMHLRLGSSYGYRRLSSLVNGKQ